MSRGAILFISDIHYSLDKTKSQFCEENNNEYYQKWINCIEHEQQERDIRIKYLIICGDLVEEGKKQEYYKLHIILEKLCNKFHISKEHVLVIPGNHDISRTNLSVYCDEHGISDADACNMFGEKLKYYIEFYKKFKNVEEFDPGRAILDQIFIEEENLWILGLNSVVKESYSGPHVGFVDISKLEAELCEYTTGETKIFVAAHHSFTDTRGKELATIENAGTLKDVLNLRGINTYIYGHHHTSESKTDAEGGRCVEIGSIGQIIPNTKGESDNNRFTIGVLEGGSIRLLDYSYSSGAWDKRDNHKYVTVISTCSSKENPETDSAVELVDLPQTAPDNELKKQSDEDNDVYIYEHSEFLFDYLKRDGNYKEGHFHWGDGRKTRGWINIASFLGNIEILEKIKESMIDIYEQHMMNVQVVVGYGLEGNIIGSSMVSYWIEHGVSYYFYPSVHKRNEYIDSEKSLWNEYKESDVCLLICDIMPTEEYLKEIIESDEKLKKCSELYVLALFCNFNLLCDDSWEHTGKEIKRFSLAKMNVPICDMDETKCMVCNNNLCKIYSL